MAALPDLSSIITPKQVMAQLGIDDTDMKDTTLKATGVYDDLYLDYMGWFPKVINLINDGTGDPNIQRQQLAVKAYGKFFICYRILWSGPLAFFQQFGDGSNDDRRFNIDFEKLKEQFLAGMGAMKTEALAIDTPMTPVAPEVGGYASFGIASPSTDNVRQ